MAYRIFEGPGGPTVVDENDIEVLVEDPRLLVLKLSVATLHIVLVAAHCPREAKGAESSRFLETLQRHLAAARGADLIICGVDLNGRVPGGVEGVSGSVVCGDPDKNGCAFARILEATRLWLPATYGHLHPGADMTYVHPTGSEHRIDYIAIGGRAPCLRAHSQVHLDFDTGAPREDHRLVGIRLCGSFRSFTPRAKLRRPVFDRAKLLSEEGRGILRAACRNFNRPDWRVSPDEHCQQIQDMLVATLQQHFVPPKQAAQASYFPPDVWAVRESKLRLKRLTRGRVGLWRDLVPWAFRQWRESEEVGLLRLVRKQGLLYHLAAAAIRFGAERVRKGVARADRTSWLGSSWKGTRARPKSYAKAAGIGGAQARAAVGPYRPLSTLPVGSLSVAGKTEIKYGLTISVSKNRAIYPRRC